MPPTSAESARTASQLPAFRTGAMLIGIGVGAILQVVVQLVPAMKDGAGKILTPVTSAAIGAGALALYLTGLLVTV